ncbi:hypothetical protein [Natronomonas sp.]|uniref:hypothetical protein n=1 Tax=Natronomonas sp. TaxID=2184060 RepID=UPI00260E7023|nr:hypothetical protein [Natronomonas sp.]
MSTAGTATITPVPEADQCNKSGCEREELLARIEPDNTDKTRVLCPSHRVAWLREVSTR